MARVGEGIRARWDRLPEGLRARLLAVAIGLPTGIVLGLAAWLTPDPEGHATHLQLGLKPCTILTTTGYPCPMCGATTTFALWADLRPVDAILNQPFASVLFLATLYLFGIAILEMIRPAGRWSRLFRFLETYELPLVMASLGMMIASWIYKIWLMS